MSLNLAGDSVLGEMMGSRRRRSRRYSGRRVCRIDGCATVLSIYNPTPGCGMHSI
jgi:hypothetical protein